MRVITTIFFFICLKANATVYYVSNSGNDANNGTSTGTAWQTIAKVNSSSFLPGDSIKFKSGDIWNEILSPATSGSNGNAIVYTFYGTGVLPEITGYQSISVIDQGANIWGATATSSVFKQNTIIINGQIARKAKGSELNFTSIPTTTKIVIPHGIDYTGKEIAIRCAKWIIDVTKVSSQNSGVTYDTLNLNPAITYSGGALGGTKYFFQNATSLLTTENEYAFDSTTKLLSVYSTSSPVVKYSKFDTVISVFKKGNIVFDGLKITGSNLYGLRIDSSNNITIKNCKIENNGGVSVYLLRTKLISIISDSIVNSLSGAIFSYADTSLTISNNYIKNAGHHAGMGWNGNGTYIGIYNEGHNLNFSGNNIDSAGYMGIYFKGQYGLLKNNFITNYGSVKQDGGGIYTFIGNGVTVPFNFDSATIIKSNIVMNGLGANETYGIYLDDGVKGVTVDSNLVTNTSGTSLFLKGTYNTITNNTFFDGNGIGNLYSNSYYSSGTFNWIIKKNIFYTTGSVFSFTGLIDVTENIDSNYFRTFTTYPFGMNGFRDFDNWRSYTGYDTHSVNTLPFGITSLTPVLFYNPTLSDSTIVLITGYFDMNGVGYDQLLTLKPFSHKLLWPSVYRAPKSIYNIKFKSVIQL